MDEDEGLVGDFEGQADVLLDEHDDGAGVVGDAADDGQEVLDDHRREAHAHLVDEEHLGLLHQRAGDREHLLLAARQGAGVRASTAAPSAGKSSSTSSVGDPCRRWQAARCSRAR